MMTCGGSGATQAACSVAAHADRVTMAVLKYAVVAELPLPPPPTFLFPSSPYTLDPCRATAVANRWKNHAHADDDVCVDHQTLLKCHYVTREIHKLDVFVFAYLLSLPHDAIVCALVRSYSDHILIFLIHPPRTRTSVNEKRGSLQHTYDLLLLR